MRRRPQSRHRRNARGVALLAVLCLVSLLTVLAVAVIEATGKHGQLLGRSVELAKASRDADSAIRLALLEIAAPNEARGTPDPLRARSFDVFGRAMNVTVDLDAGRVDLNFASAELLTAIFATHGLTLAHATELAARVLDWRDVDDERSPGGAERSDYEHLGRAGPRNGPFEAVGELRQLAGAEQLEPGVWEALTVYARVPEPRQEHAPPAVLVALRWADEQRLGGRAWLMPSVAQGASGSPVGEVIRLRACSATESDAPCRVATVRVTGSTQRIAQVFEWRTQYPPMSPVAGAD